MRVDHWMARGSPSQALPSDKVGFFIVRQLHFYLRAAGVCSGMLTEHVPCITFWLDSEQRALGRDAAVAQFVPFPGFKDGRIYKVSGQEQQLGTAFVKFVFDFMLA